MRRLVVGAGIVVALALVVAPAVGAARAPRAVRDGWPVGSTPLAGSPLATRPSVAFAARGSRVTLVGGIATNDSGRQRATRDAAVLDLRTKRWRALPAAPFRRTLPTGAIWAGDQLVVVGATCPGYVGAEHGCTGGRQLAAVYSAGDRSWRRIAIPKFERGFFGGPQALYATRTTATFLVGGTYAIRLDLGRDRWTRVRPDLDGYIEGVCAARSFAAYTGGSPPGLRRLTGRMRSWSAPETPDDGPLLGTLPGCTRDSVVVTAGDLRAEACAAPCAQVHTVGSAITSAQRYAIDEHRWSTLPPPPRATTSAFTVGHGGVVDYLADAAPGLRLDPVTGTWSDIAPAPQYMQSPVRSAWTRGLGIISAADRLFVYRPR